MAWDEIYEIILFSFVHRRRLFLLKVYYPFSQRIYHYSFFAGLPLVFHLEDPVFPWMLSEEFGFLFLYPFLFFKGGGRSKYNGLCSG